MGWLLCFRWSELPGLDLLGHPGMIVGELHILSSPDQVGPAVTNVGHKQVTAPDDGGDEGRAHARMAGFWPTWSRIAWLARSKARFRLAAM